MFSNHDTGSSCKKSALALFFTFRSLFGLAVHFTQTLVNESTKHLGVNYVLYRELGLRDGVGGSAIKVIN